MALRTSEQTALIKTEESSPQRLTIRLRLGYQQPSRRPTARKRCWSETDDDVSTADSESSLDGNPEKESQDSHQGVLTDSQRCLSNNKKESVNLLVNFVYPLVVQSITSTRYIRPPEHRIPPRKRQRTSRDPQSSILMETQDPNDPSMILILRVTDYAHLACPLFVANPARHKQCLVQHSLRSISSLIAHLKRDHPDPIYCPICGELFDNEFERDDHIRARSCDCHDFDITRGVPPLQGLRIEEEDDQNLREEDRWRHIYHILFPTAKLPRRRAVYLDRGVPLAISMAKDYWRKNGRELVEKYLSEKSEGDSDGELRPSDLTASDVYGLVGRGLVQRVIEDPNSQEYTTFDLGDSDSSDEEWDGEGSSDWGEVKGET